MIESQNFSNYKKNKPTSYKVEVNISELQPWKLILKREMKKSRFSRKKQKDIILFF